MATEAAPDDDARPFAANPSIAAPRRSQRQGHELEGETISVQWVFDDDEELVPATEGSVQTFGDDDAVWYDAVVNKVMKREVEVAFALSMRRNLGLSALNGAREGGPLGARVLEAAECRHVIPTV